MDLSEHIRYDLDVELLKRSPSAFLGSCRYKLPEVQEGDQIFERIFSIPGIGEQFVNSIPSNDYPVIMGTTIVYAVMLMSMILLTDIVTSIVDPRVRLQ